MDKVEEHPTHRIVSFVGRDLAERIEQMARVNDRSVSAEVRRILRAAYLVEEKR
jgi:plasmid stability protein